jgi:hypothetical protein
VNDLLVSRLVDSDWTVGEDSLPPKGGFFTVTNTSPKVQCVGGAAIYGAHIYLLVVSSGNGAVGGGRVHNGSDPRV